MDSSIQSRFQAWLGYFALLYLLFVVYGSLVPLDFVDRPLTDALAFFSPPPWSVIGPADRADWIANLVLYVPLAFLALAARHAARPGAVSLMHDMATLLSLALLAITVEFLQIFFPPRTVSLNDLVAEGAGIVLGGMGWWVLGRRFLSLTGVALRAPLNVRRAVAVAFVATYLAVALFPFDVVVSRAELHEKLASDLVGLWSAPAACSTVAKCVGYGLLEVAGGAMFGVAWNWMRNRISAPSAIAAACLGLGFGLGIELCQLFLLSGVSQGASVIARGLGVALGYRYAAQLPPVLSSALDWRRRRWWLRLGSIAYLIALLLVNGWFRTRMDTMPEAIARLAEVQFLPFYYFYFVSEQWALKSALVQAAMYSPVGVLIAFAEGPRFGRRTSVGWIAAMFGALLALIIETGKLFLGKHPDPTDILLALIASYMAYRLSAFTLYQIGSSREDRGSQSVITSEPSRLAAFGPGIVLGIILLLFVAFSVLRYPGNAIWLALGLGAYALALLRRPGIWLVVLLALLPVLDLGQWTGWVFLDEFDLFVMVTIGVLTLVPPREHPQRWPSGLKFLWSLWAILALFAFIRGVLPMEALSADSFWGIHGYTNAFRIGRAILWTVLLFVLLARWSSDRNHDLDLFAKGMTLGLVGVGLVVLWERVTFAGLWNFTSDYRAVGALSAVSTAGAQLESFLAAAVPFALLIVLRGRGFQWRAIALLGVGLAAYAVAATESRTALAGVILSTSVFFCGVICTAKKLAKQRWLNAIGLTALILALASGLTVIAPATLDRFGHAASDFETRLNHWKSVVAMMGTTWVSQTVGKGLGTFPSTFYWNAPPDRRPSLFSFKNEERETYVRMGVGTGMYLDQIVPIESGLLYTVRARIRSAVPGAVLKLLLCDKWILYSTECRSVTLPTRDAGQWQSVSAEIDSSGLGSGAWPFRPTVKLTLEGFPANAPLDVTDVGLSDATGHNLVKNGQFALAGTHWFVSGDENPWPWNIFNLFVEIFFEQGWLGLTSFVLLLGYSLTRLMAQTWRGDNLSSAFLAAIIGFFVPALFDSIIDEPRMRLLLMLLLVLPILSATRGTARQLAAGSASASPNQPLRMDAV